MRVTLKRATPEAMLLSLMSQVKVCKHPFHVTYKFVPFNHPMFNQTADGKGEPYVHQIREADNLIGPPFEILSDKAVK